MASRNVYKILGSLGPAGCIATFMEKLCYGLFFDAYEQGDPAEAPSEAYQEKAREQREKFVQEVFELRGGLERMMESKDDGEREKALDQICEIIFKHKTLIAKSESGRLTMKRMLYNEQSNQYKRLVEESKRVNQDTNDNLIKMTAFILKQHIT